MKIFRALLIAAVNTIKEFLAFATKECLESGLKNATIVGELNNEDGVFSGFSNNDFINLGKDYKSQNNAIYEIRFMPVVSSNSGQQIINCEPLFNLGIIDGKLYTYNFGERQEKGGATLDLNTMYDAKITINNYNKIFELKKANEQTYTTIWSGTDYGMNTTANTDILIGRHSTLTDASFIFSGSVDMNNTSITIDGQTTYFYSTIPEVGDSVKLNDGMATSNYDWSAYPVGVKNGAYTQTGTIEQIKEVSGDTVYVTQEPEQDNKDVSIKAGEMYYAYTNENDSDDSVYTTDNPVSLGTPALINCEKIGTPIQDGTTFTNFSQTNNIKVPVSYTNTFKLVLHYKAPSSVNNNSAIIMSNGDESGNTGGMILRPEGSSTLKMWAAGSSYWSAVTAFNSNIPVSNNSTGWLMLDINGLSLTSSFSSDGNSWTQMNTYTMSEPINWYGGLGLGGGALASGVAWGDGKLYLEDCYMECDGIRSNFIDYVNPSIIYNSSFEEITPQPSFTVGDVGLNSDVQIEGILYNNKGLFSGFSFTNFLNAGKSLKSTNSAVYEFKFTTGQSITNGYQQVAHCEKLFTIEVYNGALNTFNWQNMSNVGGVSINPNTTYWAKIEINGTNKTFSYRQDGAANYTQLWSGSDTGMDVSYDSNLCIGMASKNEDQHFNGVIDMSNSSVTIDGQTTTFYNSKSGIIIENNLYKRNSNADNVKPISGVSVTIDTVDNTTIQSVTIDTTDGYIDTPYYAYTNTNDNTDTLYATDNPISKGTFNLENASVVGTLTDNNGIFSGFTTSNYLLTQDAFNPQNQNWNIEVNLITGDNVSTEQGLIGGGGAGYKVLVEVYNQHFRLMLSSNNSFFNILNSFGSYTVQPSTEYWVRISYDTITGYKLEYKTSSADTYTLDISTSDTTNIYNVSLPISLGANKYSTSGNVNYPFYGSIDMLNTSITIDNVTTHFGSLSNPSVLYENTGTTEFTPIVLDPQPSFAIEESGLKNATIIGELNNEDGVFSGFSSSSGIVSSTTFSNTFNTFEILMKIKTSNNITDNQIFFCTTASTSCEIALNVWSGTFAIFLSSNGQSWDIANAVHGLYSVLLNTDYYVKLVYNGSNYVFSYSLDGATFINDIIINDSTKVGSFTPTIGNWVKNGTNPETNYFSGSIDLNNTSIAIDGQTTNFYNPKSGIIIENDLYERNSTKDDYIRTLVPATIETSANITTSNNDNVITDGSYHLFNLTIPTGMTPIIESNGINYQTSDMPLLLKKNSSVGFLLKDGNNAYYRNTWVITRDYDLHYQQINFSYPSGATVTCKVNNAPQNDLTPICYCGDVISWTCDNAGTITTGTYTVKYSTKDGNIQTITIS